MAEYLIKTESELPIYRSTAGTLYSISCLFAPPYEQRLLVASGISGNVVIDSATGLNGVLHNGFGLYTASTGTITLLDTTKVINESTILITGTVRIEKVLNNTIQFTKGTLSRLIFYDTVLNIYEFIFCEGEGVSNIIHNLYPSCNLQFDNFTWLYNNEYFGLTFNDWEDLPNSGGTANVDIPKKLSGTSNYLSPTS